MKKLIPFLFLLISNSLFSQSTEDTKMGRATLDELKMDIYEKDSSANALILDEKVFIYSNPKKYYRYTRDYYVRIKFFNKEDLDRGTFRIRVAPGKKTIWKENIEGINNLEGITYNLSEDGTITKDILDTSTALVEKLTEYSNLISFVLPNVKEGSVIEFKYSYTTRSYGILPRQFQSDIPKLKMDYELLNATDYDFYIRLSGMLKPTSKEVRMKKKCVKNKHECYYVHYTFDSIPAFYEEDFMTSRENFISKLSFEREYESNTETGTIKGWESINKSLRKLYRDNVSKTSFFKKRIPKNLVNNGSKLKVATEIYRFIQNHYTWNEFIGLYEKIQFNKVYKEKSASVSEINLSLLNALRAYKIDANIALLSTRDNGRVTKLFPSPESFNYLILLVNIDGKEYYLDASRKHNSFGQIPFECLNGDVRILNLFSHDRWSEDSFWKKLKPITNNKRLIKSEMTFNPEEEAITGKINITSSGYYASGLKESLQNISQDEHLTNLETRNVDLEINNYKNFYINRTDKAFVEDIDFSLDVSDQDDSTIRINPLILYQKKINPFKMKERLFPVDYGYNRREISYINFIVPEGYTVKKIPEYIQYSLPNRAGNYLFRVKKEGNKISILSQLNIPKPQYSSDEYFSLKELYNKIIKAENSYIELEKTTN
ncbi:MAG: hypothetical protein JXR05_14865 [Flavobacteriaceae bacterium]